MLPFLNSSPRADDLNENAILVSGEADSNLIRPITSSFTEQHKRDGSTTV
ncbi:MAG: hypothetical protein U0X76_06505 [Bacteroidia bacterium]